MNTMVPQREYEPITPEVKEKLETGIRVLRDSVRKYGLDVEYVCHARQKSPVTGQYVPYACGVTEPYGFAPEAACPIHDPWD